MASISFSDPGRWVTATIEMLLARRGKNFRLQGKAKGFEASIQDQILGEGPYADLQDQALYDKHIVSLCHTAALNAWERIQELGKQNESYIRVKQGQRESCSNFIKIN